MSIPGTATSHRLDAGRLDHLAPFHDLAFQELVEGFRRGWRRIGALPKQDAPYLGLAQDLADPFLRDALINKGPALVEAQTYAYEVLGFLSAGIYAVAAVLMVIYMRRTRGLRQA